MNLASQVCSLELAKKLKELGVKQESFFYWEYITLTDFNYITWDNSSDEKNYSAFTASELLELLPTYIKPSCIQIIKGYPLLETNAKYCVRYYDADIIGESDENLSSACAKMLIYLLENKLLEI